MTRTYGLNIRVDIGPTQFISCERVDLLEKIDECGSLSHAAFSLGMSYKKAWYLLRDFNALFAEPLTELIPTKPGRGATHLTPLGSELVHAYKQFKLEASQAVEARLAAIESRMVRRPRQQKKRRKPSAS